MTDQAGHRPCAHRRPVRRCHRIHTPRANRELIRLSKEAEDGRDGTVYGAFSTNSFYDGITPAPSISMAIVKSAAEALEKGISAIGHQMRKLISNLERYQMTGADE